MQNIKKLIDNVSEAGLRSERLMTNFSIFGVINYPVFYLVWSLYFQQELQHLEIRVVAAALCVILALRNYWPNKIKFLIPIYWYFTILYCLPFFCSYMFLLNHGSNISLVNVILATFLLIMITDWLSFAFLFVIGTISGILCYKIMVGTIYLDTEDLINIAVNIIWIILVSIFFSYSKQEQEKEKAILMNKIKDLNQSLESKVYQRTMELEEALAIKTDFLNNISHEIRTPVHGFTVLSQELAERWNDFDDSKKLFLVENIAKSAKRLGVLAINLLDLNKLNNSEMTLNITSTNITEIIKQVIEKECSSYIVSKQLIIKFDQSGEVYFSVDKELIYQAFKNLFLNAVKFSHQNGIIEVWLEVIDKALHFSIRDYGPGIPYEEINLIFASFTQSSRTKTKAGGTGLGLSVCKAVIEAHYGSIWAENNLTGSTFRFIIPEISSYNIKKTSG